MSQLRLLVLPYSNGFPSVQNSPSGSGPFPPGQGFSQFGYPQANPDGVMPWGCLLLGSVLLSFGVVLLQHLVFLGSRLLSVSVLTLSRAMLLLSLLTEILIRKQDRILNPCWRFQSRLLLLQFQYHNNFLVLLPLWGQKFLNSWAQRFVLPLRLLGLRPYSRGFWGLRKSLFW